MKPAHILINSPFIKLFPVAQFGCVSSSSLGPAWQCINFRTRPKSIVSAQSSHLQPWTWSLSPLKQPTHIQDSEHPQRSPSISFWYPMRNLDGPSATPPSFWYRIRNLDTHSATPPSTHQSPPLSILLADQIMRITIYSLSSCCVPRTILGLGLWWWARQTKSWTFGSGKQEINKWLCQIVMRRQSGNPGLTPEDLMV